jgi:hypothetical protein
MFLAFHGKFLPGMLAEVGPQLPVSTGRSRPKAAVRFIPKKMH